MIKETNNAIFEISKDVFNTEIFKIKMANFYIHPKDNYNKALILREIQEYLNDVEAEGFKHITCKVDTNSSDIVQALEISGFLLTDTLITYRFDYNKSKLPQLEHQCQLGNCKEADLNELKDISKKAFKIDRFHSDDSLQDSDCDHYYEQWIENSFNGFADRVIVAYLDGEPVGYTTGKLPIEDKVGHLVLSAVSDKSRGKGVYTSMIHEGVRWMEGQADVLEVGTQVNNIAVQKAWIRLGFTVNNSFYVFQKVLS